MKSKWTCFLNYFWWFLRTSCSSWRSFENFACNLELISEFIFELLKISKYFSMCWLKFLRLNVSAIVVSDSVNCCCCCCCCCFSITVLLLNLFLSCDVHPIPAKSFLSFSLTHSTCVVIVVAVIIKFRGNLLIGQLISILFWVNDLFIYKLFNRIKVLTNSLETEWSRVRYRILLRVL